LTSAGRARVKLPSFANHWHCGTQRAPGTSFAFLANPFRFRSRHLACGTGRTLSACSAHFVGIRPWPTVFRRGNVGRAESTRRADNAGRIADRTVCVGRRSRRAWEASRRHFRRVKAWPAALVQRASLAQNARPSWALHAGVAWHAVVNGSAPVSRTVIPCSAQQASRCRWGRVIRARRAPLWRCRTCRTCLAFRAILTHCCRCGSEFTAGRPSRAHRAFVLAANGVVPSCARNGSARADWAVAAIWTRFAFAGSARRRKRRALTAFAATRTSCAPGQAVVASSTNRLSP
jgi:hypothetical protein